MNENILSKTEKLSKILKSQKSYSIWVEIGMPQCLYRNVSDQLKRPIVFILSEPLSIEWYNGNQVECRGQSTHITFLRIGHFFPYFKRFREGRIFTIARHCQPNNRISTLYSEWTDSFGSCKATCFDDIASLLH